MVAGGTVQCLREVNAAREDWATLLRQQPTKKKYLTLEKGSLLKANGKTFVNI